MHPVAIVVFLAASALFAQEESSQRMTNPFTTADDIQAGSGTFLSQCASCHGRDGRGAQGTPDLTTGMFRRASSDEGLFNVVAKGVSGTTMPAFNLSGREIWQTLAYLRSLSVGQRSGELVKGNPAKGRALFESSGCARCHQPRGMAPDLAEAARQRSLVELRQSITDPAAQVATDYWRIRGQAISGRAVEGVRLNEDTYTVLYRDNSGQLRSIRKSDLTKYEVVRSSPMPSFRDKLSPHQIDDILAFLVGGVQ